ncbi:hypothetical protein CMV_016976 [Castanea mollissima]|uniref:TIR domain-containing protein n=1 Tax=Castanea mollissima TaxID=60419 RepID=A0A8J4QRQ3_9ROSI|nr:hypothetical protein CMV_016976 [Castanea mollissima]
MPPNLDGTSRDEEDNSIYYTRENPGSSAARLNLQNRDPTVKKIPMVFLTDEGASSSSSTCRKKYDVFLSFRALANHEKEFKEKGNFGIALANHEKEFKEKMQRWREALSKAANVSGSHYQEGYNRGSSGARLNLQNRDPTVKKIPMVFLTNEGASSSSSTCRKKYDVFLSFRALANHEKEFKEKGNFGIALANHEKEFKEKMQRWREALSKAANVSGSHYQEGGK